MLNNHPKFSGDQWITPYSRRGLEKVGLLLLIFLLSIKVMNGQENNPDTSTGNPALDRIIKDSKNGARSDYRLWSYGFNFEPFQVNWFLQRQIEEDVKVGGSFGIGYHMTNLVLHAKDHFSTDFSFFKKDTRWQTDKKIRELVALNLFLEYETRVFDLQCGVRFFSLRHYDNILKAPYQGSFFGLYAQPLFGEKIQYSFRVMLGYLTAVRANRKEKELGVLMSPVIITWNLN